MIAVDTNILIYAHRRSAPWHKEASAVIKKLAEGSKPWYIPWPCLHEFVAITTHSKIFSPPSTPIAAVNQIKFWCSSPTLTLISERENFLDTWDEILMESKTSGPMAHDAKIAAICLSNGISTLYSADRDFSRFKDIKIINPLL